VTPNALSNEDRHRADARNRYLAAVRLGGRGTTLRLHFPVCSREGEEKG